MSPKKLHRKFTLVKWVLIMSDYRSWMIRQTSSYFIVSKVFWWVRSRPARPLYFPHPLIKRNLWILHDRDRISHIAKSVPDCLGRDDNLKQSRGMAIPTTKISSISSRRKPSSRLNMFVIFLVWHAAVIKPACLRLSKTCHDGCV